MAGSVRAKARPSGGGHEEGGHWHAPCRQQDSQRGARRPPWQRQDLAARGAPVRGGGAHPTRHRQRRHDRLGRRRRREGARDVDLGVAGLLPVARRQGQPDRHARRALVRGRRTRRAARLRVRRLRRQRRHGRRGLHPASLAARVRAGRRAPAVRQHARPRARRLLPRARVAQGRVRTARGRDRDPDRLRARDPRSDRPGRHEGFRVRRHERARQGDPDPGRPVRAGAGVPREADGRGRGELRGADGALSRGRRDLARGDRHRARGGHRQGTRLPGHLRRRHHAPGRRPAAGRDRRRPALTRAARRPEDRTR